MSQTFSLVCYETRLRIRIGQGWGSMETFYSGHPEIMKRLARFLREHENKALVLLCDERNDQIFDLTAEFEDPNPRPETMETRIPPTSG